MAERDNEKEIEKREKRRGMGFNLSTLIQDLGTILGFLIVMVRSLSTLIQDPGTILGFLTVMVRRFHQI